GLKVIFMKLSVKNRVLNRSLVVARDAAVDELDLEVGFGLVPGVVVPLMLTMCSKVPATESWTSCGVALSKCLLFRICWISGCAPSRNLPAAPVVVRRWIEKSTLSRSIHFSKPTVVTPPSIWPNLIYKSPSLELPECYSFSLSGRSRAFLR